MINMIVNKHMKDEHKLHKDDYCYSKARHAENGISCRKEFKRYPLNRKHKKQHDFSRGSRVNQEVFSVYIFTLNSLHEHDKNQETFAKCIIGRSGHNKIENQVIINRMHIGVDVIQQLP